MTMISLFLRCRWERKQQSDASWSVCSASVVLLGGYSVFKWFFLCVNFKINNFCLLSREKMHRECLGNIKWNLIKSQQCGSLRPVIIILFLFPQTCNFNHLGWPRISTGTPYVDGNYCKQGVLLIDNVSTPRRSQMCSPARLPEWLWQRWHSWIDIVWLTWGGLSEEN